MVKFRQARYCNLKLILIFLVVYGHWIEPGIGSSKIKYIQYWWIYVLHMPLFTFLSGLFLREEKDCIRQVKRLLPLYCILQLPMSFFSKGNFDILEPFWHLWYLLSFCTWAVLGWLGLWLCKKWHVSPLVILAVAILAGTFGGYLSFLDRILSGSRTIVFFPFFWLGLICGQDIPWQKYRMWGVAALGVAATVSLLWGSRIPADFLYHAKPYGAMEEGAGLRLLCYVLSSAMGFFLLTMIPDKRLPCTKGGADTMPAYLLHALIVGFLREIEVHWIVCMLLSGELIYIIYKVMQWYEPLYGVIGDLDRQSTKVKGRRDRHWPDFKRFMSNMARQCIGFF